MNLHDLHPNPGTHRRKRRLGRGHGSGRGKTAGKGTKGQDARTGGGWNPRFEGGQTPIHLRLPHRRGFRNPFRVSYEVVKLSALDRFESGARIDRSALEAVGLLRRNDPRPIKVLANGDLSKPLHFDGIHFTRGSYAKVVAVGGSFSGVELPVAEDAAQDETPDSTADDSEI